MGHSQGTYNVTLVRVSAGRSLFPWELRSEGTEDEGRSRSLANAEYKGDPDGVGRETFVLGQYF